MKKIISILLCLFLMLLCGCQKNEWGDNEHHSINDSTVSNSSSTNKPTVTYTPVESITLYCGYDVFDYTKYYLELEVNDIVEFSASVKPSNATNKNVSWRSSSSSVVVSNGLICAVSSGSATITVTAADNVIASFKVVVVESEISLTKSNYSSYLDIKYSLTNSSASAYVYSKQPLYQITSLNMTIAIQVTIVYSRSGYRDVSKYQSISLPIGIGLNASYSLYSLIQQNTPSYYTLKSVEYGNPVVTSVSGTMKKIL